MKWPWPISKYAAIPSLEWWVLRGLWRAYTIHVRSHIFHSKGGLVTSNLPCNLELRLKVWAGPECGGHKKLLCFWCTSKESTVSIYRVESCCYMNMAALGSSDTWINTYQIERSQITSFLSLTSVGHFHWPLSVDMLFCQSMLMIPFPPVFIVTHHPFLYLSSLSVFLCFVQSPILPSLLLLPVSYCSLNLLCTYVN